MINFNNVKIFSGNSNLELAKKIVEKAGLQFGKAEIQRFKDEEVYIEIEKTIREKGTSFGEPSPISSPSFSTIR